jgi:hypothetical protein
VNTYVKPKKQTNKKMDTHKFTTISKAVFLIESLTCVCPKEHKSIVYLKANLLIGPV